MKLKECPRYKILVSPIDETGNVVIILDSDDDDSGEILPLFAIENDSLGTIEVALDKQGFLKRLLFRDGGIERVQSFIWPDFDSYKKVWLDTLDIKFLEDARLSGYSNGLVISGDKSDPFERIHPQLAVMEVDGILKGIALINSQVRTGPT